LCTLYMTYLLAVYTVHYKIRIQTFAIVVFYLDAQLI
jgi:hypothetical protein